MRIWYVLSGPSPSLPPTSPPDPGTAMASVPAFLVRRLLAEHPFPRKCLNTLPAARVRQNARQAVSETENPEASHRLNCHRDSSQPGCVEPQACSRPLNRRMCDLPSAYWRYLLEAVQAVCCVRLLPVSPKVIDPTCGWTGHITLCDLPFPEPRQQVFVPLGRPSSTAHGPPVQRCGAPALTTATDTRTASWVSHTHRPLPEARSYRQAS